MSKTAELTVEQRASIALVELCDMDYLEFLESFIDVDYFQWLDWTDFGRN